MIHREDRDPIAIIRMEHGKVNAIDSELLSNLADELSRLEQSPVRAVVLTGTGKSFSAGVDLFRVLDSVDYLDEFLPLLTSALLTLFTFPRPVVAAVNGHAIAGGCILACACDYRMMVQGSGRIGVPELAVGVPFPALALEILRFAVPPQYMQEMVYTGNTHLAETALQLGLIDEMVSSDVLLDRACEMADRLGAIPPSSFHIVKRQIRRPTIDRYEQYTRLFDHDVRDGWASGEIQTAIRDYLQQTIGKSK